MTVSSTPDPDATTTGSLDAPGSASAAEVGSRPMTGIVISFGIGQAIAATILAGLVLWLAHHYG